MNMDCILFHYVRHKPVDLSHLTTTGAAGCIIRFSPPAITFLPIFFARVYIIIIFESTIKSGFKN